LIKIDEPIDEHFRWLQLSHNDQFSSQSQLSRFRHSNLCHKFGFPTRRRNSVEIYRLICVNSRLHQDQQENTRLPIKSRKFKNKGNHLKTIKRQPQQAQQSQRGLQNVRSSSTVYKARNAKHNKKLSHLLKPVRPKMLDGLLLKDLSIVLQKSERDVQEIIEDLQLEGKIYQNERGGYLPL